MELNNFTMYTPQQYTEGGMKVTYVEHTVHAISLPEIVLAIGGYIILIYFWIMVNKDKEGYSHWKNPNGREVNLYKILKRMMIWYPIVVIILATLQIYLILNR